MSTEQVLQAEVPEATAAGAAAAAASSKVGAGKMVPSISNRKVRTANDLHVFFYFLLHNCIHEVCLILFGG